MDSSFGAYTQMKKFVNKRPFIIIIYKILKTSSRSHAYIAYTL